MESPPPPSTALRVGFCGGVVKPPWCTVPCHQVCLADWCLVCNLSSLECTSCHAPCHLGLPEGANVRAFRARCMAFQTQTASRHALAGTAPCLSARPCCCMPWLFPNPGLFSALLASQLAPVAAQPRSSSSAVRAQWHTPHRVTQPVTPGQTVRQPLNQPTAPGQNPCHTLTPPAATKPSKHTPNTHHQ